MPKRRAAREGLDDDHEAAAVRAETRVVAISVIGRLGWRPWDGKQLAGARDVVCAGSPGFTGTATTTSSSAAIRVTTSIRVAATTCSKVATALIPRRISVSEHRSRSI